MDQIQVSRGNIIHLFTDVCVSGYQQNIISLFAVDKMHFYIVKKMFKLCLT